VSDKVKISIYVEAVRQTEPDPGRTSEPKAPLVR
jgi:hypothetical protein